MNVIVYENQKNPFGSQEDKLEILYPYLKKFGKEALSYSTLQEGLEYFLVKDYGYISYISCKNTKVILSNPVCNKKTYKNITDLFTKHFNCNFLFTLIDEEYSDVLRSLQGNCMKNFLNPPRLKY